MKESSTDDTIIVACCQRLLFICLRVGTVAAVAQLEDIEERMMY